MGGRSRGAAGASAPPTRGKSTGTPHRTTSRWNVYLLWRLVQLLLLCLLGHKDCIIACWAIAHRPSPKRHRPRSAQRPAAYKRIRSVFSHDRTTLRLPHNARLIGSVLWRRGAGRQDQERTLRLRATAADRQAHERQDGKSEVTIVNRHCRTDGQRSATATGYPDIALVIFIAC
jgi:hypothetical protein